MSERSDNLLLEDIIISVIKIERYVENLTVDQFELDDKTIDAVVRNFEIIGEASNKLSDKLKSSHSEVEWHKLIGLRNRVIHHYFGVDTSIVWNIIKNSLPLFLEQIKKICDS